MAAGDHNLVAGTPIQFGSEGGPTDDAAWSTESINDGAGRRSALYDQGVFSTARPAFWRLRYFTQHQGTGATLGNVCRFYVYNSDGTHPTALGTSDAAVTAESDFGNFDPLPAIYVTSVSANTELVKTHPGLLLPYRYFGFGLWNAMGATITSDPAETKLIATPMYWQTEQ